MSNRKHNRSHCRRCDRAREPGERFSARGKCADCGDGRMIQNYRQLNAHSGPFFEHWRRRVVASVGGVLAEDLLREEFDEAE